MQSQSIQVREVNRLNAPDTSFRSEVRFVNSDFNSQKGFTSILESISGKGFDITRNSETEVKFSNDLTRALASLNVQLAGFGNTHINKGVADFGIIGGAVDVDTAKVDIIHDGGLTFKAGDKTVNLTDFIITNLGDKAVLTGAVTVNNDLVTRAPLFDLEVGKVENSGSIARRNLELQDVKLKLTSEAAATLNKAFGVDAFQNGFNIGTANVDTKLANPFKTTIANSVLNFTSSLNKSNSSSVSTSNFDITRGGETSVKLSNDLVNALNSLQVKTEGFGNTGVNAGAIEFPVIGGAADVNGAKVDIIHGGGLTLSNAKTKVDLTDFIITNLGERAVLTGAVVINDDLVTRAPLFDLKVGSLGALNSGHPVLNLDNVGVTLTKDAAGVLNKAFGVSAFSQGLNVGTADVEAFLR